MTKTLLKELRHFPEFVKLSHSVFALPFALSALLLAAQGLPDLRTLILVMGAVVTARFAAMAFNRIVDIKIDAANPRTAERHLPSGRMSISTAYGMVVVGAAMFISISVAINQLAGFLSPIALFIVLGYSFTKRFTRFSHFFLGVALGLAPLGAWLAVCGDLGDGAPWLLAIAVICWVAGFDMIYALQDLDFDKAHGLYSMVVTLGPKKMLCLVRLLHFFMFLLLTEVGFILNLTILYFIGLGIVLTGLLWEHWLMRTENPAEISKAFLQANAIVSFGYLAAVILGTVK